MSISVSQKVEQKMTMKERMAVSFGITDEIFAVSMQRDHDLTTAYMAGLIMTPVIGWTGGTLMGALAGAVLPVSIRTALGVMLYGMFIAIVIPPARKERSVMITAAIALVFSCLFTWAPVLKEVSAGLSIVICTVAAAAICAVLFPVQDEEAEA
jgi:predicted branched-subunit amino acid permease